MDHTPHTEQEVPTENEVGTESEPQIGDISKNGESGWQGELSKTFDEIEARGGGELANDDDDLYAPHAQELEKAGIGKSEYRRMEHSVAQAYSYNRDEMNRLVDEWEWSDKTTPHPHILAHRGWELAKFREAHPDVAQLDQAIADHLQKNPLRKGETIRGMLKRGYDAVKSKTSQPKAQSKTAKKQPRHIRDDVEASYDAVMSKAGQR